MTPDPFATPESTRAAIAEAHAAIAKMEATARGRRDMTVAQYRAALDRHGMTLAPCGPTVTLPDGRQVDGSAYGATRRERVTRLIAEGRH